MNLKCGNRFDEPFEPRQPTVNQFLYNQYLHASPPLRISLDSRRKVETIIEQFVGERFHPSVRYEVGSIGGKESFNATPATN